MEINNPQLDFSLEVHYESFIPYEYKKNYAKYFRAKSKEYWTKNKEILFEKKS